MDIDFQKNDRSLGFFEIIENFKAGERIRSKQQCRALFLGRFICPRRKPKQRPVRGDRVTGAAVQPTDLNREKLSRLPSGDYVHRWRNSGLSPEGADKAATRRSLRTPTVLYPQRIPWLPFLPPLHYTSHHVATNLPVRSLKVTVWKIRPAARPQPFQILLPFDKYVCQSVSSYWSTTAWC